MTLPEDLAKLAGNPSTWEAEVKTIKAKLAEAEARIKALDAEIKAMKETP